jgi:hypothetical protein
MANNDLRRRVEAILAYGLRRQGFALGSCAGTPEARKSAGEAESDDEIEVAITVNIEQLAADVVHELTT